MGAREDAAAIDVPLLDFAAKRLERESLIVVSNISARKALAATAGLSNACGQLARTCGARGRTADAKTRTSRTPTSLNPKSSLS